MELPGEKLLIKLWETLAEKGVGSLLSPWQTIREGKARNEVRKHELLLAAQAEADVAEVRAGRKRLQPDGTLLQLPAPGEAPAVRLLQQDGRIEPALDLKLFAQAALTSGATEAARTEINASKAIIYAEDLLADDAQTPPDRKLDEDWLFTWRDHAGRVSSEDLQRSLGRVLAGEVKSPGCCSIRTLDFLRSLSREEAEEISKLACFVVERQIIRDQNQYLEERGVTLDLLLRMRELGVVLGVEAIGLETAFRTQVPGKFLRALRSHSKALIVEHEDATRDLKLKVYPLTSVGAQLLGLGSFTPDVEYLKRVGKVIASQGYTVLLADWRQISEREGQYFNKAKIDA